MGFQGGEHAKIDKMASPGHDLIVASLSRKIRELGFNIIYIDGEQSNISSTRLSIPPKIINHRPDIIGENVMGNYCVGEAKTITDLKSTRTQQQIIDFSNLINLYDGNYLLIGIPFSAEKTLDQLLIRLSINTKNLIKVKVPDLLLK